MDRGDLQRIKHIKTYCEDIAGTIRRFGDEYENFQNDSDYRNSISMSIMQIGELSTGLSDEFRGSTNKQIPWSAIRSMRNLYAHAYRKMDRDIIWNTATTDIPALLRFCESVIEREFADSAGN